MNGNKFVLLRINFYSYNCGKTGHISRDCPKNKGLIISKIQNLRAEAEAEALAKVQAKVQRGFIIIIIN